jgi:hypothetical protein
MFLVCSGDRGPGAGVGRDRDYRQYDGSFGGYVHISIICQQPQLIARVTPVSIASACGAICAAVVDIG